MSGTGGARRRVLVIWLVLAALAVAIALHEFRTRAKLPDDIAEKIHGAQGSRLLLPVAVEEINSIEIAHRSAMHRFERDASGAWFYHGSHAGASAVHAHKPDPQQAQRIEKAFTGLGRTRMERSFDLDVQNPYGVTSPQMVVLIYRKQDVQPFAQFAVGDLAPDGLSRYVLPVGGSSVVTIADYQITNLLELIEAVGGAVAPSPAVAGSKAR